MKPFATPEAVPTAIGHSTNLVGVPMDFLAHAGFNDQPVPLHISGVREMNPALFDGTTADDEYYLPTQLDPAVYEARIKTHRAEYINERDSATIKSWGLNSVRIPVPYFIFGDRAPFIGCIDELDKAFN